MVRPLTEKSVDRYLRELEPAIKKKVGVIPEDVLCDTRDFLLSHVHELREQPGEHTDEELYEQFVEAFGSPQHVAEQCEKSAESPRRLKLGNAPNWRICCTNCGRSAPAEKVGITRTAARSFHKYVGGWCQNCRSLRWMRLLRDLDANNLCDQLGEDITGEELRADIHRPWAVVGSIAVFAIATSILVPLILQLLLPAVLN